MKRVVLGSKRAQIDMSDLYEQLRATRRKGSPDGTRYAIAGQKGKSIIFGEVDGQAYAIYLESFKDEIENKWRSKFIKYEELSQDELNRLRGRFSV